MSSRPNGSESFEMSVVAYFHQWTAAMLQRLMEVVPATDSNGVEQEGRAGGGGTGERGFVTKEDLLRMGLDVWSKNDRAFVQEMARLYLGADVEVQGQSVDCCGVRIL